MICTDPCPLYQKVCRFNDYWHTEDGVRELSEYYGYNKKDGCYMLEKCKFCGSAPKFVKANVRFESDTMYKLSCDRCGFETEAAESHERAAEIWNGRNAVECKDGK